MVDVNNYSLQGFVAGGASIAACPYLMAPRQLISESKALRVFGALLLTALALFSNSVGVYCRSVFFIATFITELSFIENIAALFFNRSDF